MGTILIKIEKLTQLINAGNGSYLDEFELQELKCILEEETSRMLYEN